MTAPVAVLVLLGLIGVPLVLLQTGRGFRQFDAPRRGAFRGAVIGYALASALVLVLLLVPPFVWPPASPWVRISLVGGLLLGPALGALIGWLGLAARR